VLAAQLGVQAVAAQGGGAGGGGAGGVDAAVDGLGTTPLGAAARRGDDAEVRRLLGAAAAVDAAPAQVPALRPLLLAAAGGHAAVARLLREAGAAPLDCAVVAALLLEECRDGNVAAIAALLGGGADVEAGTSEERRPTVCDVVLIVDGEGKGSVATVTKQLTLYGELYLLQGARCGSGYYQTAQVSVQVTALAVAAAGGHVAAVRLLLDRGATAGGESGAAALRAAASDEMKALLRDHGASQ
jgi:ankyrin repeat protein